MILAVEELAFKLTVFVTAALNIKLFITVNFQGHFRFKAGSRPPEDEVFGLTPTGVKQTFHATKDVDPEGAAQSEDEKAASLSESRWNRIVMNDLENIPIGLLVAWANLLAIGTHSDAAARAHSAFVLIFFLGRLGHTFCYARGIQPWRTVFYMAGVLSVFAMSLEAIIQMARI